MTLLAICQQVARLIPIAIPTVIVGSTDPNASLLYAFAIEAAEDLYTRADWSCLQKEYTFPTVASTATYTLPTDFGRMIDDTGWDRTTYWQLRGPRSPQDWQLYKSSILGGSIGIRERWRIKANSGVNQFTVDPVPTSVRTMVYEYVSSNWCTSSGGTGQTAWAADTDLLQPDANAQFTERLVRMGSLWRMLERLGMAYDSAQDRAENEIRKAVSRDGGAPTINLNPQPAWRLLNNANIPDGNWG